MDALKNRNYEKGKGKEETERGWEGLQRREEQEGGGKEGKKKGVGEEEGTSRQWKTEGQEEEGGEGAFPEMNPLPKSWIRPCTDRHLCNM